VIIITPLRGIRETPGHYDRLSALQKIHVEAVKSKTPLVATSGMVWPPVGIDRPAHNVGAYAGNVVKCASDITVYRREQLTARAVRAIGAVLPHDGQPR
jgi:hypothetical protein